MTTKASQVEYLSAADTAKLVRAALKREFPGIRFSITSKTYSGGASVRVKWTDGPREKRVEAITRDYCGGGFDGMIDMAYSRSHWLRPSGATLVRYDSGTEASRGSVPSLDNRDLEPVIPTDAVAVRFGADFIFCNREISNEREAIAEADAWVRANCHVVGDRFGSDWVSNIARNMAFYREPDQTWAEVFEPAYYRNV